MPDRSLFARAEIPAGLEDELRALASAGRVVFVMRSAGWLNYSFIRWLVRRLGLPALGAAIGVGRIFRFLIRGRGRFAAPRAGVDLLASPAGVPGQGRHRARRGAVPRAVRDPARGRAADLSRADPV